MKLKSIIQDSKKELFQKKGLIKLSFWIGIGHTISNLFLLTWNINNLLLQKYGSGIDLLLVFNYFIDRVSGNGYLLPFILLVVFVLFGYFILFPMGLYAIVNYINKGTSIGKSFSRGVSKFFIMFEFNTLMITFSIFTFIITFSRLYSLDVLSSNFVIGLAIMWFIFVIISSTLWPYVKYFIVLEGEGVYQAIKRSMSLSVSNFRLTLKAVIIEIVLWIYFYIRLAIVLFIPGAIMYIIVYFNIFSHGFVEGLLWIIGVVTLIMAVYVLGAGQAYMDIYWYKIFQKLREEEKNEE